VKDEAAMATKASLPCYMCGHPVRRLGTIRCDGLRDLKEGCGR